MLSLALGIALPYSLSFGQESQQDTKTEQANWGTVIGQIIVEGKLPEIPLERVGSNKDRPVCLVDGKVPADDQLVVGDDGGLRDVFVILTPVERDATIPVHPSYLEKSQASMELDNIKCRFAPHAMAVMTGQTVLLKNSDSVGHNCKITSMNNERNMNLPAGGEAEIKLEAVDRVPANVTCDIHPWMDALILAKDHPYVAITGADGNFEMKNVPSGEWKLQFWHQRVGFLRKLEVPEMKVDRRGQIAVEFQPQQTLDLGKMKLPSSAIK
ncbi:hypothetical protein N9L06_04540 [Mariniblastus sp.]|nr:hypothetical protein [Mariniblastus sp.]